MLLTLLRLPGLVHGGDLGSHALSRWCQAPKKSDAASNRSRDANAANANVAAADATL